MIQAGPRPEVGNKESENTPRFYVGRIICRAPLSAAGMHAHLIDLPQNSVEDNKQLYPFAEQRMRRFDRPGREGDTARDQAGKNAFPAQKTRGNTALTQPYSRSSHEST